MFNWVKSLFVEKESELVMKVSPFVEPNKADISEPVLAIVECMKKYPSRFKLTNVEAISGINSWVKEWTVEDVKTSKVIKVESRYPVVFSPGSTSNWKWLTKDELFLLKETFEQIIEAKIQRMYSIERAKMKEVYK